MAAKLKIMTVIVASALLLSAFACGNSVETPKSAEPEARAITGSSSPTPSLAALGRATPTPAEPAETPRPPKADEVVDALARVFNKSVSLDETRAPSFVVGDFNGDGSEDLAVVTKATESSLPEINNELANWILEDPRAIPIPGSKAANELQRPKPVQVEKTDSLLAIIHGVGAQGWRNREARQTFLLRNGAGTHMLVRSIADLRRDPATPRLPPLRGDAISETMNGHRGLIFWTGAKYSWSLTVN
ncbi:MAG TPA: FG-GAP repeat protein [Pyrinomonadaceae bacterium]|nr:FG-GAP repeat protein [Pyrinomonadaceae bacterium]